MNLIALLRFWPHLLAVAGLAVGLGGVRSCSSMAQDRAQLQAQVASLEQSVEAERDCTVPSHCANRAAVEALAAERLVAERVAEIRENNETRVAAAVANYVRSETVTRRELEKALEELEREKQNSPACARWAGERVACIVRPLGPAFVGSHETDDRRGAAAADTGNPAP